MNPEKCHHCDVVVSYSPWIKQLLPFDSVNIWMYLPQNNDIYLAKYHISETDSRCYCLFSWWHWMLFNYKVFWSIIASIYSDRQLLYNNKHLWGKNIHDFQGITFVLPIYFLCKFFISLSTQPEPWKFLTKIKTAIVSYH